MAACGGYSKCPLCIGSIECYSNGGTPVAQNHLLVGSFLSFFRYILTSYILIVRRGGGGEGDT